MRKPSSRSSSFSSRERLRHNGSSSSSRGRASIPTEGNPSAREADASGYGEATARGIPPQSMRTGGGEWHEDLPQHQASSAPTAALSPDSAQAYAHPSTYEGPGTRERIRLLQEKLRQRPQPAGTAPLTESLTTPAQPPATLVEPASVAAESSGVLAEAAQAQGESPCETSTDLASQPAPKQGKVPGGVLARWTRRTDDSHNGSASSASFEERLAEKKAEKRRVRAKRLGIIAGVFALVAGIVWAVAFSPLFALDGRKINVTLESSSAYLQPQVVASLLAEHEGESIATMNTGALADEIHEKIPLVSSAEITRSWLHGLRVHVQPATPVACVVSGSSCRAVDAQGRDMNLENVDSLPHFASDSSLDEKSVASGLATLGALSEATRASVAQIGVDRLGQITLQLADGRQVFWGTAEENLAKSQVLDLLLTRSASYYDVSSPSAPVSK